MDVVDIALVLAGAGTFLLRYLPMAGAGRLDRLPGNAPLYRGLQAMGPAAIAALAAVSLLALPPAHGWSATSLLAVAAGGVAVFVVRRWTGSLALAALVPALVYGAVLAAPAWLSRLGGGG